MLFLRSASLTESPETPGDMIARPSPFITLTLATTEHMVFARNLSFLDDSLHEHLRRLLGNPNNRSDHTI